MSYTYCIILYMIQYVYDILCFPIRLCVKQLHYTLFTPMCAIWFWCVWGPVCMRTCNGVFFNGISQMTFNTCQRMPCRSPYPPFSARSPGVSNARDHTGHLTRWKIRAHTSHTSLTGTSICLTICGPCLKWEPMGTHKTSVAVNRGVPPNVDDGPLPA